MSVVKEVQPTGGASDRDWFIKTLAIMSILTNICD